MAGTKIHPQVGNYFLTRPKYSSTQHLDKIFSFLETKDLLSASQVCASWNSSAQIALKRRLSLHSEKDAYSLKFSKTEPCVSKVQDEPDLKILPTDASLTVSMFFKTYENPSLLAITLTPIDWCRKITKLVTGNCWQVEDWNASANYILSKFCSLTTLELSRLHSTPNFRSALKLPLVEEVVEFQALKFISIFIWNLEDCKDLNLEFVSRCPNLEKFEMETMDHYIRGLVLGYRRFEGSNNKLYLRSDRNDMSPRICEMFFPLLNKLPCDILELDHNINLLRFFNLKMTEKLRTVRIEMQSLSREVAANKLEFVLDELLQDHRFSALNDLQLKWHRSFLFPEQVEIARGQVDVKLPSVNRLKLSGIDLDDESNPAFERLLKALPNVQLVHVEFDESCRSYEFPSNFLKYTPQIEKLKHLVWHWQLDFWAEHGWMKENLKKIRRQLAQHSALESLTIVLDGDKTFPALEAIVLGCEAAPRMRLLQAHISSDSQIEQSWKFKYLKWRAKSICIKMLHESPDLSVLNADLLDQVCADAVAIKQ